MKKSSRTQPRSSKLSDKSNQSKSSLWSPLSNKVFKSLWIAALASNIGTWMHDVGAAWLMTSLAPTPIMVSLVQAAATFPLFLFILPAGAIADVVNKKYLLIITQVWMILAALTLSILTFQGITTAFILLICVFMLAVGMAFTNPAWQAIIPDVVPKTELPSSIALSSIGINIARAIGPALGGLLVAAAGSAVVFLLNSISYIGVAVVLYKWKPQQTETTLPRERIFSAIRLGMRHVRYSEAIYAVLFKAGAFILGASAMWAVLPLYVRQNLGLNSLHYGILIGSLGVGAVFGGTRLSKYRSKFPVDKIVSYLLVVFAVFILLLSNISNFYILCAAMFLGGIAWITLLASFNIAAQSALPSWVRGRGLSIYLMVFFGGMSIGSAAWGSIATFIGIPLTLEIAAAVLLLGLLFTRRFKLAYSETINFTVSKHWPAPRFNLEPEPDQGPVLVLVEYEIDPERKQEFIIAMKEMFLSRKRNGAQKWNLFNDISKPNIYVETFIVQSWIEHLRQHERVTEDDKEIEKKVRSFHVGNNPVLIKHLIANKV